MALISRKVRVCPESRGPGPGKGTDPITTVGTHDACIIHQRKSREIGLFSPDLDSVHVSIADKLQNRFAKLLLAGYISLFLWAGIAPYDRATWYAENIPIVGIALSLVWLYWRGFVFSPTAYGLMACLLYLHTIGGHYTFERVPFTVVTDLFGFERNHFDRVAHFSVGFYAYAIAEAIERKQAVRSLVIHALFPVFSIAFVAMGYELIEWWYAAIAGGASGAAFLGSQGDIWDAQKDMLSDTLGAIVATGLYFMRKRLGVR